MITVNSLLFFSSYFLLSCVLILLFLLIYQMVTPYHEVELMKQGNIASVISLGGALVGFCLPLASIIRHSIGLIDLSIWAGVALIVQILLHLVIRLFIPNLKVFINQNISGPALWHAICAISIGLINAACMA